MLPQPQPQRQSRRPATILIADDEPILLRAMFIELNRLGFETLIAHNGSA